MAFRTAQSSAQFWRHWGWLHWLILLAVAGIASKEVYELQRQRLQVVSQNDEQVIDENIQEFNTQAERLAQLEVLPPVKEQWQYVPAIASRYGVKLTIANGANYYDGPLAAWHGEINGNVGSVLVAAMEMQKTVPTYLYDLQIQNGNARLGFSVIGSE